MDGHLPCLGGFLANPRIITHQKEVYYRLGIKHLDLTHKSKTRRQLSLIFTYHPQDGHTPTKGWSPIRRKYNTVSEFGS